MKTKVGVDEIKKRIREVEEWMKRKYRGEGRVIERVCRHLEKLADNPHKLVPKVIKLMPYYPELEYVVTGRWEHHLAQHRPIRVVPTEDEVEKTLA